MFSRLTFTVALVLTISLVSAKDNVIKLASTIKYNESNINTKQIKDIVVLGYYKITPIITTQNFRKDDVGVIKQQNKVIEYAPIFSDKKIVVKKKK